MLFRLYIVSIALKVLRLAVCLSDKLSSNKWLVLCCINFTLLLGFYFQAQDNSKNDLTIGKATLYLDFSSRNRVENQSFSFGESFWADSIYLSEDATLVITPFSNEVDWETFQRTNKSYTFGFWADNEYIFLRNGVTLQNENPFKRFIPEPSYKIYPIQNEESYLRKAVFYAPLVLCVIQIFTSILAFISLHRKRAEGVQLKLTNEKLRLEIEKLKEERDKSPPPIIIAKY